MIAPTTKRTLDLVDAVKKLYQAPHFTTRTIAHWKAGFRSRPRPPRPLDGTTTPLGPSRALVSNYELFRGRTSCFNSPEPESRKLMDKKMSANRLFQRWGCPAHDLFTTIHNRRLPAFVSPLPHPQAWATDALTMVWNDLHA